MLGHGARFVVASEHDHVARVVELEAEKEYAHFERIDTSIDVVAKEQKARRWDTLRVNDLLEHMDHIIELSVDVTDDNDRLLDAKHVGFVPVDFGNFLNDSDEAIFLDMTFNHKMFADQVHLWHGLSIDCVEEVLASHIVTRRLGYSWHWAIVAGIKHAVEGVVLC